MFKNNGSLPVPGRVSDELYAKIMARCDTINVACKYRNAPGRLHEITLWLHVLDCVHRGTASPMEAYDALMLGYVPAFLEVRESSYRSMI